MKPPTVTAYRQRLDFSGLLLHELATAINVNAGLMPASQRVVDIMDSCKTLHKIADLHQQTARFHAHKSRIGRKRQPKATPAQARKVRSHA